MGLSRRHTRDDSAAEREEGDGLEASRTVTQGLARTATNGNGLEASRTITQGQVNGRGNWHENGHTNGFGEIQWADDVSAALAQTSIR